MSVFDRLSNSFNAAKRAWQEPTPLIEQKNVEQKNVSVAPQPAENAYYADTVSKAGDDLPVVTNHLNPAAPPKSRLDIRHEALSADIDALIKENPQSEKLLWMIYHAVMALMRQAAKSDLENIHEISIKIKNQAHEIKGTYNTWQGLTITVVSATVSIAGGCAGLSPLLPISVIAAPTAHFLGQAATPIGTAGTGLSGIGSIFNNRSEGDRQVMQIYLKRSQDTEEERKGSKHTKNDHVKTAKTAAEEFARNQHEAKKAAVAA